MSDMSYTKDISIMIRGCEQDELNDMSIKAVMNSMV